MREWFKYLPEFTSRALSRADSSAGIAGGIILLVFFAIAGMEVPRNAAAGLVVVATLDGAYAAYRYERALRAKRETAFRVWAQARQRPTEPRAGGWLTRVEAEATVTLTPKDSEVRVGGCWLVVIQRRRGLRTLWRTQRKRVGRVFGIDAVVARPPFSMEGLLLSPPPEVPPSETTFPQFLRPGDDSVSCDMVFRSDMPNAFGIDGVRVSGVLDYEVEVSAAAPETVVSIKLWWPGKR